MTTVQCSCGHLVSAATAEQLLAAVEAHIDAAHNNVEPARPDRAEPQQAAPTSSAISAHNSSESDAGDPIMEVKQ